MKQLLAAIIIGLCCMSVQAMEPGRMKSLGDKTYERTNQELALVEFEAKLRESLAEGRAQFEIEYRDEIRDLYRGIEAMDDFIGDCEGGGVGNTTVHLLR